MKGPSNGELRRSATGCQDEFVTGGANLRRSGDCGEGERARERERERLSPGAPQSVRLIKSHGGCSESRGN